MRWLLLFAITPGLALGAEYATVEGTLRIEQQARVFAGPGASDPLATLELFPSITGLAHAEQVSFTLGYAPSILQAYSSGARPEVLHAGHAQLELKLGSDRRLVVSEQASYGDLDYITFATATPSLPLPLGSPTIPLQPLPIYQTLHFSDSTTELRLEWGFTQRLKSMLDLSYLAGGGVGNDEDLLPQQKRPQVTAALSYAVTPSDFFTTNALANDTVFSDGREAQMAELTEQWRRVLGPSSEFTMQGGASLVATYASSIDPAIVYIFPEAQLGFRTRLKDIDGDLLTLEATAELTPYVDWITSLAFDQAGATLTARWMQRSTRWEMFIRGRGDVAIEAGALHGQSLWAVEVGVSRPLVRQLKVELGSRVLWQRVPLFSTSPFIEWLSFASLTWADRAIF